MQIGMIGLGRMGANMVRRLIRGGHQCVVFDANQDAVQGLAKEGAVQSELELIKPFRLDVGIADSPRKAVGRQASDETVTGEGKEAVAVSRLISRNTE